MLDAMNWRCLVCFSWLVVACSDVPRETARKAAEKPARPDQTEHSPSSTAKPLAAPSAPPSHPDQQQQGATPGGADDPQRWPRVQPKARACAIASRKMVADVRGPSALAFENGQLYVWFGRSVANASELVRMRVDDRAVDLKVPLSSALVSPPAVSPRDHRVATLHDDATLLLTEFDETRPKTRVLARGVDRRFAPALRTAGQASVVAYTHAVDQGMHVSLARSEGDKVTFTDVTPVSHGACAPTFVLGAAAPTLVMIDARAGVSPLLEVPLDQALKPGAAIIRTPVSQPYSPTLLGAVSLTDTQIEVAYTAVGRAAATAIGRVPLREAKGALPLLPSLGYGQLHFAVALGARASVFAMQAPREAKAHGPLALELVVLDRAGEGPHVTLEGLTEPGPLSLIFLENEGKFALLHRVREGAELVFLRCDA